VGNAIAGTLYIVGIACLIGVPLGVGAGVFLAERGDGRVGDAIRFTAEVLSGVPSIVVGIVAYGLVVLPMRRFSALAGGVALAVLMVPTLARSTEELVRLVPRSLREASLALGVPQWRTSLRVVLRTALGGIMTAILLAVARAAGETAPLLFTSLNNQYWNFSADQPTASLTVQIFNYAVSPYQDWHDKAWSAALVLLLLVGSLSLAEPAAMKAKIDVRALNAWFRTTHALRDVSLTVPENSVLAIIGPSGCGKSTFVRCINRMHELVPGARQSGQVLVDGQDLHARRVDPVNLRRRVGMVFQRPNPFPTMSIFDNVIAGLRLNGVRGDYAEVAENSLRQAALWDEVKDRLQQSALSLSGGQQQRLCIARALSIEPEVLLMDEPASALDPIATAKIEELIHELRASLTIVIVTHNMQQAARVSDATAFFYLGELIEHGATEQIFTNPREPRTEDYVTGKFG